MSARSARKRGQRPDWSVCCRTGGASVSAFSPEKRPASRLVSLLPYKAERLSARSARKRGQRRPDWSVRFHCKPERCQRVQPGKEVSVQIGQVVFVPKSEICQRVQPGKEASVVQTGQFVVSQGERKSARSARKRGQCRPDWSVGCVHPSSQRCQRVQPGKIAGFES